jgi:hypothetical protein
MLRLPLEPAGPQAAAVRIVTLDNGQTARSCDEAGYEAPEGFMQPMIVALVALLVLIPAGGVMAKTVSVQVAQRTWDCSLVR